MKILLVDDHAVVRQGYASLLTALLPEVTVVEAASGELALRRVQEDIPSLVVLDLSLPGISGLETCRRLRQRLPLLPVLIFSMHDELALVRQALDAGASGYLTKRCAPDVLVEAVRKVLAGQPFIEQPLATELACQRRSATPMKGRLADMTPREMEIFLMLARGVGNREIAERLCISSKTVSNHMALLKSKLAVSSQAELVHLAIDQGLLRVGDRTLCEA
jgi:DNA-binding NarL/FixJ family response regulator